MTDARNEPTGTGARISEQCSCGARFDGFDDGWYQSDRGSKPESPHGTPKAVEWWREWEQRHALVCPKRLREA